MKPIPLILIFSISLLQAKTWSSYTSMNCGISYAFAQDSLVQIRSTEINQDVVLSISCTENGFDDTFPITDSIGNIVDWEEKQISVTGYSIHFFDESNPAEDSLWAKHLNTWDTIDTIDIKEFIKCRYREQTTNTSIKRSTLNKTAKLKFEIFAYSNWVTTSKEPPRPY